MLRTKITLPYTGFEFELVYADRTCYISDDGDDIPVSPGITVSVPDTSFSVAKRIMFIHKVDDTLESIPFSVIAHEAFHMVVKYREEMYGVHIDGNGDDSYLRVTKANEEDWAYVLQYTIDRILTAIVQYTVNRG